MRGFSPWLPMAAVNLLLPIGILMFARGFFPYKPFLPGLAAFDNQDVITPAPFSRVVFMVVDALRRCRDPSRKSSRALKWIVVISSLASTQVSSSPSGVFLDVLIGVHSVLRVIE